MRIIRYHRERVWYPHHPYHLDRTQERNYTGETIIETRILLNPFETKLLHAAAWVRDTWQERVIHPASRIACRWLGRCGTGCRGRRGHYPETR